MAQPLAIVRRYKLLSQRDLATLAGVSDSTVFLIESEKAIHPTLKVMRRICDALHMAPLDIEEFRRELEEA